MGNSADAKLCYGFAVENGFEFPWEDDDIEEWWRKVNSYAPPFECFKEDGEEVLPGISDSQIHESFEHKWKWAKDNPLPFELVYTGTFDDPTFILAVPSSILTADWEHPERLEDNGSQRGKRGGLPTITQGEIDKIKDFIAKYEIDIDPDSHGWYLSAFYG